MQANNRVKFLNRRTCEMKKDHSDNCQKYWKKIIRIKDHESQLGEFDIYFCKRCKLGFTNPYPSEGTSKYLYEAKKCSDFDLIRHSFTDSIKDYLAGRQLRQLAGMTGKSNICAILDYATGNGRFALCAKKIFPSARVDAVDYQADSPGLLVTPAFSANYYSTTKFKKINQRYDVIILRHVLEHTHHPIELLKFLKKRLSINGILYIEVPNLDSGCAKIFGKYWKGYYVPRHIFHFTIDSLKEIIEKAGLFADIRKNESPLMGNTISILTGLKSTNIFVQGFGIFLYPFQLSIESLYKSSTCLNARCRHKSQLHRRG